MDDLAFCGHSLTLAQLAVWREQQLLPDLPLYNMGGYLRIEGELDADRFEASLRQVVAANDALRTILQQTDNEPLQSWPSFFDWELLRSDFSSLSDPSAAALDWVKHHFHQPYPLYGQPLFRFGLARVTPTLWFWLLGYHHLIADATTASLVASQVAFHYNSDAQSNKTIALHHNQPFAAVVARDLEYRNGKAFSDDSNYWKTQCRQAPPLLLGQAQPRFEEEDYRLISERHTWPREVFDKLANFANANGTSLFQVFLGIVYSHFALAHGRDALALGLSVANRPRKVRETPGLFSGALPLWLQHDGKLGFMALVQTIASDLRRHYRHRRLSLDQIQRQAGSLNRLYDIEVGYKSQSFDLYFGDCRSEICPIYSGYGRAPLTIYLTNHHEGEPVTLEIFYKPSLFSAQDLDILKVQLRQLAETLPDNPTTPLRELPLTHPDSWVVAKSRTAFPQLETIAQRFEARAAIQPHAIALCHDNQKLSYAELNRQANRLSHRLIALGAEPEMRIGVCLERSPQMIVSLLAVLKTGACYVPLDPAFPQARLTSLAEDAGLSLLIVDQHAGPPIVEETTVINLSKDRKAIDTCALDNPVTHALPEHAAYMIYTSGSTGKPKGVIVNHANVGRLLDACVQRFQYGPQDVWTMFHSFAFDFSVWEMWGCLTSGGRLLIVNSETALNPPAFYDLLKTEQVTVLNQTPSAFAMFMAGKGPGAVADLALRWVIFGGEALQQSMVSAWQADIGSAGPTFINMYGITETTVHVTFFAVDHRFPLSPSPIGEPLDDLHIHLLDPNLRPVPKGYTGEIYVAGAGLARGYHQRPDLTAERFIPHPFAEQPGERLYRSGDLARLRQGIGASTLEYLGRIDKQLQIRGFRIEPGEIEAALKTCDGVSWSLVRPLNSRISEAQDDLRLAAYVLPREGTQVEATRLRNQLATKVPKYMLPAVIHVLHELPLTVNGKLDLNKLPQDLTVQAKSSRREPTPLEATVIAVWREFLNIQDLDCEVSFFEVGGDSLLVTRVLSRFRELFDCDIPVAAFFAQPTVAALAQHLAEAKGLKQRRLPELSPCTTESRARPLSFAQERLWFLDRLVPDHTFYNIPAEFQLLGHCQTDLLRTTLTEIVARHQILRTAFRETQDEPRQHIIERLEVDLPEVDLSALQGQALQREIRRLADDQHRQPFDLSHPPLLRTKLLRIAEDRCLLVITMHHIIADGWSLGVLLTEMGNLYQALADSKPLPAANPLQYGDFAQWQRTWLKGSVLQQQTDYWRKRLKNMTPLDLPTDKVPPQKISYRGGKVGLAISPEQTAALVKLGNAHGCTLFMTLFSAFASLMARFARQEDVAIGYPIANRHHAELESLIGFFVNTQILRVEVEKDTIFTDLVQQVRDLAIEAFANQDVPFETLVKELQPDRAVNRNPLVRVIFALQNAPLPQTQTSTFELAPFETDHVTVRFDLECHLWQRDGGLSGFLLYADDLFEAATAEVLAACFLRFLDLVVAQPELQVGTLPLTDPKTHARLLQRAAGPSFIESSESLIHHLFEKWAAKTPTAPAIEWADQAWDYAHLNAVANGIAQRLITTGITEGDPVGLLINDGPYVMATTLAILKTGAIYVPLDASQPQARLLHIAEDAELKLVVVDHDHLPHTATDRVLNRPYLTLADCQREASNTHPASTPHRPLHAYLMYTSGSTGRPKGILIPHRAVVRLVAPCHFAKLNAEDRFLQFAPFGFDASTFEIWGALLNGATLVLSPSRRMTPKQIANFIKQKRVTVAWLTAGLFSPVIDEALAAITGLRYLLTGGDVVSPKHVSLARKGLPHTQLINGYGPTENTTFTSCHLIDAQVTPTIPIGRPIAGTQVYVLEPNGQLAPFGFAGELYIGGVGLASHYLKQPALTAERFLPCPFGGVGERLYRSGDLVRYRHDGTLAFLGRIDRQVKIRGFRIEPAEIENLLVSSPLVDQAAVLLEPDAMGEKSLTAFVTPTASAELLVAADDSKLIESEHLQHWQQLYEDTYSEQQTQASSYFDISGWQSSYTGKPIEAAAMHEWVDATVARISALQPQAILEIGCGTGLLLSHLAPQCRAYFGTDFSAAALTKVKRLCAENKTLSHVQLKQFRADQLADLAGCDFDVVVLNSIIQYFPSLSYLERVIRDAIDVLGTTGTLFIGDIRNLALLEPFHAGVIATRAANDSPIDALQHELRSRISLENELLIDPAFFTKHIVNWTGVADVIVQPKRGTHQTEMNLYRYDVIIRLASNKAKPVQIDSFPWRGLENLHELIARPPADNFVVQGIPDRRIHKHRAIAQLLHQAGHEAADCEALWRLAAEKQVGVEPETLWQLQGSASCHLTLLISDQPGCFDVLLHRQSQIPSHAALSRQDPPEKAPQDFANVPYRDLIQRNILTELGALTKANLPSYMQPTATYVIDHLPLTPNGKLDQAALKKLKSEPQSLDDTPPRNANETRLMEIFCDVLGRSRVGIHEDFFDIGGHSLLATKVVSRVESLLVLKCPLRLLFEHPTIAQLSEALSGKNKHEAAQMRPIHVGVREGNDPLSFAQERMWFLSRLARETPLYHSSGGYWLRGPLNKHALNAALNEIRSRHEILRTHFPQVEGVPVQVIAPFKPLELHCENLNRAEAEQQAQMFIQEPFDLATGPLFQYKLYRTQPTEHLLVIAMHHIIFDGWSMGVFLKELQVLYQACINGQASPLPPLNIQYADYAKSQKAWIKSNHAEQQLAYWRQRLEGLPECLDLYGAKPRPTMMTFNGHTLHRRISEDATRALKTLAVAEGATLFMLMQAALVLLLSRFSGRVDLAIGTPIANRNQREIESLIGFFVNTLVLRTDLSGNPTFRQLLERVRNDALAAYAHQDIPFEVLVKELIPRRDTRFTPFFQVMFSLQNAASSRLQLTDLAAQLWSPEHQLARFDLVLNAQEDNGELKLALEYNTDLFEAPFAQHFIDHYLQLLSTVVATPNQTLATLDIMTQQQRTQLITLRQHRHAPARIHKSLFDVFHGETKKRPHEPALAWAGGNLSYRELSTAVAALAEFLRSQIAGEEAVVAVWADRSPQWIIAFLSCLRAGLTYMPIHPNTPAKLRDLQLEQTHTRWLLGPPELSEQVRAWANVTFLDWQHPQQQVTQPLPAYLPERRAYLIHTSGSTGRPKPVAVAHGGLAHLIPTLQSSFKMVPGDRLVQLASPAFDASIFEIITALVTGACLVLPEAEAQLPGPALARMLHRQRVTHLIATPSALSVLPKLPQAPLKVVMAVGERCDLSIVKRWADVPYFYNGYGPTEGNIMASFKQCSAAEEPTLGKPIANATVYVLDQELAPLPCYIPGELYLGNAAIARGYANMPAATAERFLPDPFSDQPGARMYRTGDLCSFKPSGELCYHGRIDNQIKIRGFRVEPGEIEAAMYTIPGVHEAAVALHSNATNAHRLIAYYTKTQDLVEATLRQQLAKRVPSHMIPDHFILLDTLPRTSNGKLDRASLPQPPSVKPQNQAIPVTGNQTAQLLQRLWCECLEIDHVGLDDNFFDLGGHSILLVKLQEKLEQALSREIPILELFRFPTVREMSQFLRGESDKQPDLIPPKPAPLQQNNDIAVIAMDCRFPDAANLSAYAAQIFSGTCAISAFDDALGEDRHPDQVAAAGLLEDIDRFDAAFFNISPREAASMDPQHRIFLELCYHILEKAAYDPSRYPGSIGVYAGSGLSTYMLRQMELGLHQANQSDFLQFTVGCDKDFMPSRVAYKLGLRGPAVSINTACSSSLVAVQTACQSLLSGQCDLAIAGGATINVMQEQGYRYQQQGILSKEGRCRPFDAAADGTVPGSGAGVVLLKRLDQALEDGDQIHAIIKGAAINNDGSAKLGFSAPAVEGQDRVISKALDVAGIDPATIGYVETHGTGTSLGDPVEVQALTQAYRRHTQATNYCALGASRAAIGHVDTAAGVASLIKAILVLKRGVVPPLVGFHSPNPAIQFADSPFTVSASGGPWPLAQGPRRCAVSSFGIGGTNAHVILQQAPDRSPTATQTDGICVRWSATTPTALEQSRLQLLQYLQEHRELALADLEYSLAIGRKSLPLRASLIATDRDHLLHELADAERWVDQPAAKPVTSPPAVAFLFPGNGEQYPAMAADLYHQEPLVRTELDACADFLTDLTGSDPRPLWFAEDTCLERASVAQPFLFSVNLALGRFWLALGLKPSAMIGHSLGEYSAACLAGVFSREDGLRMVVERARLFEPLPPGAMLAVQCTPEQIASETALPADVALACVNTPEMCVLSGPVTAIENAAAHYQRKGTFCRPIKTAYAYHSPMVEAVRQPFKDFLQTITLKSPKLPFYSNLSGKLIRDDQATSPRYWADQARFTAQFQPGLERVIEQVKDGVLLSVGPGPALGRYATQCHAYFSGPKPRILSSLRHHRNTTTDGLFLRQTLAALWQAGVELNDAQFYASKTLQRIELPTYPFERQRFWFKLTTQATVTTAPTIPVADNQDLLQRLAPDQMLFAPNWQRQAPPQKPNTVSGHWLLLADECDVAQRFAQYLKDHGASPILVTRGLKSLTTQETDVYAMDYTDPQCYMDLLQTLAQNHIEIHVALHFGAITSSANLATPEQAVARAFFEPLHLAQAIAAHDRIALERLVFVTAGMQSVTGTDQHHPLAALILGPNAVIPREIPQVNTRCVDLDLNSHAAFDCLLSECKIDDHHLEIAYRGTRRWTRCFESVNPTQHQGTDQPPIRNGGVYLFSGGLGGIALGVALHLARTYAIRPVLLARSPLPAREDWHAILKQQDRNEHLCTRIRMFLELEALVPVHLEIVDICDETAVKAALERIAAVYPKLDGLLHVAGVPGGGLIPLKTPTMASAVLAPKFQGTLILDHLLADAQLDLTVYFSSQNAFLGEVGQIDYCAANAFLGAYADYRQQVLGQRTLCLDWDAWQWNAWTAVDDTEANLAVHQYRRTYGLSFEEGAAVMVQALHNSESRLVISCRNFVALEHQHRRNKSDFAEKFVETFRQQANNPSDTDQDTNAAPRPLLTTAFIAPQSELESVIAEIWCNVLGFQEIGVEDGFFELGGHSLQGLNLIARLNETFELDLKLNLLFNAPSVRQMAEQVELRILEEIEAMEAETAVNDS